MTARLHAFSDGARWALIVEVVTYTPRGMSVDDTLYAIGNCLRTGKPSLADILPRVENMASVEDVDELECWSGAPPVIRGASVTVKGAARGDELAQVFRRVVKSHREELLATERELRTYVPADVPEVLVLDDWKHPEDGTAPSRSKTFRSIAEVLRTGDPSRYEPAKKGNTYWKNWPESGSM